MAWMKAIRQTHVPTTDALVHLQDNGGLARRIFGRRLDDEKVGTHVRDAQRVAVDDQLHLHFGRIRAVILFRNHERNTAE